MPQQLRMPDGQIIEVPDDPSPELKQKIKDRIAFLNSQKRPEVQFTKPEKVTQINPSAAGGGASTWERGKQQISAGLKALPGQILGRDTSGVGASFKGTNIVGNLASGFYSGAGDIAGGINKLGENIGEAVDVPLKYLTGTGSPVTMDKPGPLAPVEEKLKGIAQQYEDTYYTPGYEPGAVGTVTKMAPSVMMSKSLPGGQGVFPLQMGGAMQEEAKAGGAGKAVQMGSGIVGGLMGGAYNLRPGAKEASAEASKFIGETVAPAAADYARASMQTGGMLSGVQVLGNIWKKYTYKPDTSILEGADQAFWNGAVLALMPGEVKGNTVTNEQAAALAKFARENPIAFAQKYKDVNGPKSLPVDWYRVAYGIGNARPSDVLSGLFPGKEKPKVVRTQAIIDGEIVQALKRNDTEGIARLKAELDALKPNAYESLAGGGIVGEAIDPTARPAMVSQGLVRGTPVGEQGAEVGRPNYPEGTETGLATRVPQPYDNLGELQGRQMVPPSESPLATPEPTPAVGMAPQNAGTLGMRGGFTTAGPEGVGVRVPSAEEIAAERVPQEITPSERMGATFADDVRAAEDRVNEAQKVLRRKPGSTRGLKELDAAQAELERIKATRKPELPTVEPPYSPHELLAGGGVEGQQIPVPETNPLVARGVGERTPVGENGAEVPRPNYPEGTETGVVTRPEMGVQIPGDVAQAMGMDIGPAKRTLARSLGLDANASWPEITKDITGKIGKLGASARETAIKILDKVKGITRQVADAIANKLHEYDAELKAMGNEKGEVTLEQRVEAKGAEAKTPEAETPKPPEEVAHRELQQRMRDQIDSMFPGEENRATRHRLKSQIPAYGKAEAVEMVPKSPKERVVNSTVGRAFQAVQRTFAANVGEKGEASKESIREISSGERLANAQRWEVLKPLRKLFERMTEASKDELIDSYEAGNKITGMGGWDSGSEWARDQYNKLWVEMNRVGIDSVGYLENYLTLMVKNKDQVNNIMARMEKSMAGKADFLKTREIANYKTLREMGIEPQFTNIADIMAVSMSNMEKLIGAKKKLNAELEAGRIKAVKSGEAPSDPNLVKIDERIVRKIGGVDADGKKLSYYADPGVATVFNNHVSQGFEANPNLRDAYKLARTAADTSVGMQLAINGYHFVFSMADAATSTVALGIAHAQQGNVGKGLYNIVKGLTPGWAQADIWKDGRRLRKALLSGEIPEDLRPTAEAFLMAGGTATSADYKIDPLHRNALNAFKDAQKALQSGDHLGALADAGVGALKLPVDMAEILNKPLMEHLIPTMKVGVFSQLAALELAKGEKDLRPRLQKAWQVVEDRLGQMTYDNLFWDQTARQVLHVATRSVGWNLGTINVAKGATDILGEMGGAAKRAALKATGRGTEDVLRPTSHRSNYIMATMGYTALTGLMTQYLLTGEAPKPLKDPQDEFIPGVSGSSDAFTPRTGGTNKNGKPYRTMMAGYTKDLAEFVRMIGGEASIVDYGASKLNPLLSNVFESMNKKNAFGSEISGTERLTHLIPKPIGMEQYSKEREKGKSVPRAAAAAFGGFPEAKKDLTSTAAENLLRERTKFRRPGSTSEEVADAMQKANISEAVHAGNREILQDALDNGTIGPNQVGKINKMALEKPELSVGVKNRNLKFDDLYSVWLKGNPDERKVIVPELYKRFQRELKDAGPNAKKTMLARKSIVDAETK